MSNKLTWNSSTAAMQHVVEQLTKSPTGLTENRLNTRHDPVLVGRAIDMLVSRKVIEVFYDESKVGSERKIYKVRN